MYSGDRRGLGQGFWAAAIIIGAVTAYLRLSAIGWGAPFVYHPDEHFILKPALDIVRTGNPDPHWFQYPSFLIYLQSLIVLALKPFVAAPRVTNYTVNGIGPWDILPSQWPFLEAGRIVVAAMGVAGVVLLAAAGGRLLNLGVGLAAAAFLMASPLHNESSHFLTTDVPATTFLIAAFAVCAVRRPRWLLAGVLAGLAAGTKYTGGLAVVAPAILAVEMRRPAETLSRLGRIVLGAVLGFLITTPFAVFTPHAFWAGIMAQRQNYLSGVAATSNWRWYIEYLYRSGLGPIIAVLAALGIVGEAGTFLAELRNRGNVRPSLMLLLPPLAYIPWLASYPAHAERNLIVVLPFLCLLAARFLDRVCSILRPALLAQGLFAILALVAVFSSAQIVVGQDESFAKPDTRTEALQWVEAHVPQGSTIAREEYTPQVRNGPYHVIYVWSLARRPYEWYLSARVQYLIVSSNVYARSLGPPHLGGPGAQETYRVLFGLPMIAEFRPGAKTNGPTIRIYKVPLAGG